MSLPSSSDPDQVCKMFSQIAPKYDLANDILSIGLHRRWKKKLVSLAPNQSKQKILDVATGTGDLVELFLKQNLNVQICGLDFCPTMIEQAQKRFSAYSQVEFQVGDALKLPYENEHFDVVTISFGIRNVSDPHQALAEMGRVLKPTGKILILEFGQVRNPLLKRIYGLYSKHFLPLIGGLVSGAPLAYQYLDKTASEFPSGNEFIRMIQLQAHFKTLPPISLYGGISYIYQAFKGAN